MRIGSDVVTNPSRSKLLINFVVTSRVGGSRRELSVSALNAQRGKKKGACSSSAPERGPRSSWKGLQATLKGTNLCREWFGLNISKYLYLMTHVFLGGT